MAKRKIVKQKKINEYAPLILVIVIAIAAMGIIPILLDEKFDTLPTEIEDSLKSGYDKLEELVNKLENSLNKLDKNVNDLKDAFVDQNDFETASKLYPEKLSEINEFYDNFINSYKNGDITYVDHFNYILNEKDQRFAYEYFEEYKNTAINKLARALSVSEVNEIVSNFKKSVNDIPSIVQILNDKIAEIDKDGVVDLKDIANFAFVKSYYLTVNKDLMDEDAYKALGVRINDVMYNTLRDLALNDFVSKANALPANSYHLLDTDVPNVDKAQKALELLTDEKYCLFDQEELDGNSDYQSAIARYVPAALRAPIVKEMKGTKITVGSALYINAQIDAKKNTKIDANAINWIKELEAMIAEWDAKYGVISDKNDPNYCEDIYKMVDRDKVREYRLAFYDWREQDAQNKVNNYEK